MPRLDIYTPVHNAVRKLLFDHAMFLARVDASAEAELRSAVEGTSHVLELLDEHAMLEDRHVHTVVAERQPYLAARAAEQHLLLDKSAREVRRVATTVGLVTEGERRASVGALRARFNAFVADQLRHLAFEETEMNAALWRDLPDGEIESLHVRIKADVPPLHVDAWRELLLASMDPADRAFFFGKP